MKTRKLGSFNVSVIGLGCNNFGGRVDEAGSIAVIHAALDHGINFFDTADIYGGTKSEEFVGKALRDRRDQAIIATKFGIPYGDEPGGAKPAYIRHAVDMSLKRLGVDVIDLYQLHTPDKDTPIMETLGALNDLVKEGKVREIGCSIFSAEQLREADEAASGAKFVSVQNEYSLFKRDPEQGVLEECLRLGQGFLPYFPIASGLLSGKYRRGQAVPEGTRISTNVKKDEILSEAKLDAVERLAEYAESSGHTLLELAISWLLARQPVSSVIAGATKVEQVAANAAAGGWEMTAGEVAEIARLAELSPVGV
ncbi:MAG TPA: aldo/keto reductase [Fimbriimonadaceae bacterium]|nr:aldo/keto reductase [Fimbriimonadaceae bacterium]